MKPLSELHASSDVVNRQSLDIIILEVDMTAADKASCSSCNAAVSRVREAVDTLRPVFEVLGIDLSVAQLTVSDLTQAKALGLRSSPMIRVGDIDLYPEHREAAPDGSGWTETERIWRWDGTTHDHPPLAMVIDAVLRAYAHQATAGRSSIGIPPYVRQFLQKPPSAQPTPASGCS